MKLTEKNMAVQGVDQQPFRNRLSFVDGQQSSSSLVSVVCCFFFNWKGRTLGIREFLQ